MARRRTPALRAFAPDSMVGLAFTQHSTPPDLDDPSYTARADFLFDARRNELDILSAYASPERIPKKRQGAYNTLAVSNEGRAFIVDNQTLEGEPPSAALRLETSPGDSAATKWSGMRLDKPGAAALCVSADVYTLRPAASTSTSLTSSPLLKMTRTKPGHAEAWPLTVSTLDWFARSLASTVMDYAAGGWQQAPKRAFYVTNTQDCRGRGAHWISVAIGLRWVSPPPL